MKIAVYHKSVPDNNKNPEKPAILQNFSQGATTCGDSVIDVHSTQVAKSDVGVIQGWVTTAGRPHLNLRQAVIQSMPYVVSADSNLLVGLLALR